MKGIILLLLLCNVTSAVKHSLKYFVTASPGLQTFPEFVGFATVDNIRCGYCDSRRKAEPLQDWAQKLVEDYPQFLELTKQRCVSYQSIYRATIDIVKQQLNQTGGVHILQNIFGCEWDDETGEADGFNQFGYDGEDFIVLDSKTMTWVAANPQAAFMKHKWGRDLDTLQAKKFLIKHECPEMLKKLLEYLNGSLQTEERPSMSLLQKTPSSPVSCHATGFYRDSAMMFWRKEGEELHEHVDHGEILPNHDGTFQVTVDLNLSAVTSEDWRRYDCVFQLSGVKDDIVTKLDKAGLRTNWVSPSGSPVGLVIGVVSVGFLLLALLMAGLFFWKRNNNGFRPANSSDSSVTSSVKDAARK